MHLSPPVASAAVCSKAVVLLFLIRWCMLLLLCDSVIVLCFVVRYFVSILVLQSSRGERERERERASERARERAGCFALFVVLVSRGCCVVLSHDATYLSAVCDCGISCSYSLFLNTLSHLWIRSLTDLMSRLA